MDTRKIFVVVGILLFIGAIVLGNVLSSSGESEETPPTVKAAINVPVIKAVSEQVEAKIKFTGNIVPEQKIDVFSEVTGVLTEASKRFKSGALFEKGDLLIEMDNSEFLQSLHSQRSRFIASVTQLLGDVGIDYPEESDNWKGYVTGFDPTQMIKELPTAQSEKFKLFLTGRNVYSDFFSIKQNEKRLEKYSIYAPYNGAVISSSIFPGALVRPNQNVGVYIKTGAFEIEASIGITDIPFIQIGDKVSLTITNSFKDKNLNAEIIRINSSINSSTQTVLVYLRITNTELISGEFVEGVISGQVFENAQMVPSNIFVRDNMIFIVENSIARLTEVEVLGRFGDNIIIKALEEGTLIINEFRDAVFEGSNVVPIEG